MNGICYTLFWAGRKIAQIGQMEQPQGITLLSATRRRTLVRRVAKFVQNTRQYKKKKFVMLRISPFSFMLF